MSEQNGISEYELGKLGYVKLADDEQVVKKVKLSEDEARFIESHKHLSFYEFSDSASIYVKSNVRKTFRRSSVERRLNKAYFNGYTVKKEPKYYIKFLPYNNSAYLNIDREDGKWLLYENTQDEYYQTQFTQSEINELQKDEQARELNLNALKVKVPDRDLVD